ncbi:MAG: hypothetical protein M5U13_17035 [Thermoanaerobaculia bacterium]|nr:hypothetical protein [Thermoanaerobaculia bacterium]
MPELPDPEILRGYLAGIIGRTHALERIAEAALEDGFHSDEPRELLVAIGRLAAATRPRAIQIWNEFVSSRATRHLVQLRGLDQSIRELAAHVRLPARATSDRVPGVLTRLLAEKVRQFSKDGHVILRPAWRYGYKVRRFDFVAEIRALFQEVLSTSAEVDHCFAGTNLGRLFILSFPLLELRSIHLHSVVAHELGHLLAADLKPPLEETQRFFEQLREKSPQRSAQQSLPFKRDEMASADAARTCAFREFAADIAGVLLLGIPALLGAVEVAASRGLDGRGQSIKTDYPTWGRRLLVQLKVADDEGWLRLPTVQEEDDTGFAGATAAVSRHLTAVREWIESDSKRWPVPDPWLSMGHDEAERLVPWIVTSLKDLAPPCLAKPTLVYQRLPRLFSRLMKGVPPDSLEDAAPWTTTAPSLEDILAASWWSRIGSSQLEFVKDGIAEDSSEGLERIRRLTLKAIENVDFVSRFRDRVAETKGAGA